MLEQVVPKVPTLVCRLHQDEHEFARWLLRRGHTGQGPNLRSHKADDLPIIACCHKVVSGLVHRAADCRVVEESWRQRP
jgi:hypothetical protein